MVNATVVVVEELEERFEWYRQCPCAADLARQVIQPDRHGVAQNYGNLVVVKVGEVTCLIDEIHALSLGWDYKILQNVPVFSKEYVLNFCPDLKMKWVAGSEHGETVFQPDRYGEIFIAVDTNIYLLDPLDISTVVQTLQKPHPHYRSIWVGARRLP